MKPHQKKAPVKGQQTKALAQTSRVITIRKPINAASSIAGSVTQLTPSKPGFLRLPLELRQKIYVYAGIPSNKRLRSVTRGEAQQLRGAWRHVHFGMMEADEGINVMRGLRINSQIHKEAKDWLMRCNVLVLPTNAQQLGKYRAGHKFVVTIYGRLWSRDLGDLVSFLLDEKVELWEVIVRIRAVGLKERMESVRGLLGRLREKKVRDSIRFVFETCEVVKTVEGEWAMASRLLSIVDKEELAFLRFLRALENEMKSNWT